MLTPLLLSPEPPKSKMGHTWGTALYGNHRFMTTSAGLDPVVESASFVSWDERSQSDRLDIGPINWYSLWNMRPSPM